MTELPPIDQSDFDALLELLERSTMTDVVRMLVESAPVRIATASQALAAGNGTVASTAFHTLRSGCGQLGARHLEALSANGERLARTGDVAGARACLADVEAEFARCLVWFRDNGWLSE